MRVTLFARVSTKLNPYILLFKQALERQGLDVQLEREFGLKWLIANGRGCNVIHLHWIEAAYKPSLRDYNHWFVNKLLHNRFTIPLQAVLRLCDFTAGLLLAKLRGKTIVYTVHNVEPHSQQTWTYTLLNRIAHHVVFSLSDRIHAHNHFARQQIESAYHRQDGIIVIPHGNYIGCYPNQISKEDARRQLGAPDNAFIYLFLGLIRPYKGVEELIQAFKSLDLPHTQLLIAGRVSKASYTDQIRELGKEHPSVNVIPEFIPDEAVQRYMNACDICVLPYKDLTTSGAALLALSFGRPLIAPDIASFPELITPETGILYDPSQTNALGSALRQAQQQCWSETHILAYTRQFDWDVIGAQLVALYRSAGRHRSSGQHRSPGRGTR